MSELSIPFAVDPHGAEIPIEEAIRFKNNFYRCPKCKNNVTPRKGEKRQYYAHARGALDENDEECELSSDQDIEEMVDNLRTSDIEKQESKKSIRTYLEQRPDGGYQLVGVVPSINKNNIPPRTDIDSLIEECSVSTTGIVHSPTAESFDPAEPEVTFRLDPEANKYSLSFDGPSLVDDCVGNWTVEELQDGDVFVGDQTRARRFTSSRQIKNGEWVCIITSTEPAQLQKEVSVHSIGEWTILAFSACPETEDLLEEYGNRLRADEYGFEADVILPAGAHPTTDKPIIVEPRATVLIGVTPSAESDPMLEIVPVPKREVGVIELEPTGPGNTRFYKTKAPTQGSRRFSVHQRNSSRHQLVHLHASDQMGNDVHSELLNSEIAIHYSGTEQSESLSPVSNQNKLMIDEEISPMSLSSNIEYRGPSGMEVEVIGYFPEEHPESPFIQDSSESIEDILLNVSYWVREGCTEVEFSFDTIGSVSLQFAQNLESELE